MLGQWVVMVLLVVSCNGDGTSDEIIDFLVGQVNGYIRERYHNSTTLHDSFQYDFNEHFAYSSNYSLRDVASATRARDTAQSVDTPPCSQTSTRFILKNVEVQMGVFELLYNSQWKLFFFSYNGNMTVSNKDLRARLSGEVIVDLKKTPENACITKWDSLSISRWGDFQVGFSSDNILYRPLEKVLSFILTVHVPKVVNQIIRGFSTNYTVPTDFTRRICPYFWRLAEKGYA